MVMSQTTFDAMVDLCPEPLRDGIRGGGLFYGTQLAVDPDMPDGWIEYFYSDSTFSSRIKARA